MKNRNKIFSITIITLTFLLVLLEFKITKNTVELNKYNAGNNQATYAAAKSTINSFYSNLNQTDIYVLSTNKFLCTGTNISCAASANYTNIGFINKDEYVKIGVISYLTKVYNYWTMSEEGSNVYQITSSGYNLIVNTSLSGIKPTIYLKNSLEIKGSGYYNDPYILQEPEE